MNEHECEYCVVHNRPETPRYCKPAYEHSTECDHKIATAACRHYVQIKMMYYQMGNRVRRVERNTGPKNSVRAIGIRRAARRRKFFGKRVGR